MIFRLAGLESIKISAIYKRFFARFFEIPTKTSAAIKIAAFLMKILAADHLPSILIKLLNIIKFTVILMEITYVHHYKCHFCIFENLLDFHQKQAHISALGHF